MTNAFNNLFKTLLVPGVSLAAERAPLIQAAWRAAGADSRRRNIEESLAEVAAEEKPSEPTNGSGEPADQAMLQGQLLAPAGSEGVTASGVRSVMSEVRACGAEGDDGQASSWGVSLLRELPGGVQNLDEREREYIGSSGPLVDLSGSERSSRVAVIFPFGSTSHFRLGGSSLLCVVAASDWLRSADLRGVFWLSAHSGAPMNRMPIEKPMRRC